MRTPSSDIRGSLLALLSVAALALTSCVAGRPAEVSQVLVPTWSERLPYHTSSNGVSLAWHALVMAEDAMYVVYSLASPETNAGGAPLTPVQAHLRYKPDVVVPLIEATNAGLWDDVSLGVLRFPGPPEDAENVQLEIENLRDANGALLEGRWELEMIYDTAPESDAYTLMPLWTPTGPTTQGSFDLATTVVYPEVDAEFSDSPTDGPANDGGVPGPLPTSTPPTVAADANWLQTLIVQGVNPATQDRRAVRIEIGRDGTVSVDPTDVPAVVAPPDDSSAGEPLPDLAADAPWDQLTIDEAVARSPAAIWQRTDLGSGVHLEKVVVHTFAQPDDAVVLTYSDGISVGQVIVGPGVDMAGQMTTSDAVAVQTFDMNGATVSGIGAGFTQSPVTGEPVPYQGTLWWESDGLFHSITGDATFETLTAIAQGMRPTGA